MATTELLMGQIAQITTLNVTIKQNKPNPAIFLPAIIEIDDALTVIRPRRDPEDTLKMSLSFSNTSEKGGTQNKRAPMGCPRGFHNGRSQRH